MEGMVVLGRTSFVYTLLLWSLKDCWCAVMVTVTPKVDAIKGETAILPCSFSSPVTLGNTFIEWFIEEGGSRKRVAFRTVSGATEGIDEGNQLSGRVSMGQNNSLLISPVRVEDERRFHCQVTAGISGTGEATTKLSVFFAPEKPVLAGSSQPIPVDQTPSPQVGQCTSRNGFPAPRLIWYKNSNPLPEVKDHNEPTYMVSSVVKEASGLFTVSSTLYLRPKKKDKNAKFRCTVEYSMPNDTIDQQNSESFTLNLLYPTEEVTFSLMNSVPVKEGDNVTMKCVADGNPEPTYDFTFINKGKETPKHATDGMLTLHSVTRADNGTYRCEALDFDAKDIELTKELKLIVHYLDPVKITPAGSHVVPLGESIQLECKTKGSDVHTLEWKKGTATLSNSGMLMINSASYADAGLYICESSVFTVPGLYARGNVTLRVSGKPEIAPAPEAKVHNMGDTVTLSCSAYGYPDPQFSWTPSGKQAVMVQENKVISTLTLEATETVLNGGVTCEATNEHGKDTQQFMVVISKESSTDNGGAGRGNPMLKSADKQQGGAAGVVVAVVVCVLLLLLLVTLLYCLQKNGKLPCGKEDKKEVASGDIKNDIVVEMKSEKAKEDTELLSKHPATEQ
uniref:Basal cell adhesion molecule (Lutheran blood group) n=1 Tax=Paramormyrops kingsleyae TaxID=1676925 RepID=A0A3B3QTL1_9TELE